MLLVSTLITISLFLYCYMNSVKKPRYKYYWKGFLLLSVSCILVLINLIVFIPEPLGLIRKIFTLLLALYGFWFIIFGGKKKRD